MAKSKEEKSKKTGGCVEAKTNNKSTHTHLVVLEISAVAMNGAFGMSFMNMSNDSHPSFIFTS